MSTERLFIALSIPQLVKDTLTELQFSTPLIRWLNTEQLHITLKFLGKTESSGKQAIIERLTSVAEQQSPISIHVADVGAFPNPNYPKVLWAGIDRVNVLMETQSDIEQQMNELGYPPDQHSYHPHITIGRCNQPQKAKSLVKEWTNQHHNFDGGTFSCDQVHLVKSELHPDGAQYYVLESVSLA